MGEMVEFQTEVATERGYLALPAQEAGSAVLVLHA